jgi:hypothetical protein
MEVPMDTAAGSGSSSSSRDGERKMEGKEQKMEGEQRMEGEGMTLAERAIEKEKHKILIEYPNKPASHWKDNPEDASNNHELYIYAERIIDMCTQTLNKSDVKLFIPPERLAGHKTFCKLFVMSNYHEFVGSGSSDNSMDISLTAFLFLAYLHLIGVFPSKEEEAFFQKPRPQKEVKKHLDELYQKSLKHSGGSLDSWEKDLEEFEYALVMHFVLDPSTATQEASLLLENSSRTYSYLYLQYHYWSTYASEREPPFSEQVREGLAKELKDYFSRQISPDKALFHKSLVYDHFLGCCGMKYAYIRKNQTKTDRPSSLLKRDKASMMNEVLSKNMLHHLRDTFALDAKGLIEEKNTERAGVLRDLIEIVAGAIMCSHGITQDKWFLRYFLAADQFFEKHADLKKPVRNFDPRRPYIFPLLGRWAILTCDMELFSVATGFEAILLWESLLQSKFGGKLEGQF